MIKELTITKNQSSTTDESRIVLFNDDFNSFDWVIQSLVEICDHSSEQAEQCALIVHHKGKYAVQSGAYKDLSPKCTALNERGLSAELA